MPLQGISQQLLNSLVPNALNTLAAGEQRDQQTQIGRQNIDLNKLKLATGENDAKGREAASLLVFKTPEELRANLVRRAQELTRAPEPGLDASDLIDMANRLGRPNGFSRIKAELKSDIKRVQKISKQLLKQRFIGRPNRVSQGGKNFLVGIVQEPDGTFREERVEVAGDFISTLGETAAEQTKRKIGERVSIQEGVADVKLKTEPKIKGAVTKAELEAKIEEEPRLVRLKEKEKQRAIAEEAAEIAEQKGLGAQRVLARKKVGEAASTARRSKQKVLRVRRALDLIATGKFSQFKRAVGQFIPGLDISNEELIQSQITKFVLDELNLQTGTKTDFDFKKAEEASAAFGRTTEGNRKILDILLANLDSSIEEERQFKAFVKGKGDPLDFSFRFEGDGLGPIDGQETRPTGDLSEEELDQEELKISARKAELDEQIRLLEEGN